MSVFAARAGMRKLAVPLMSRAATRQVTVGRAPAAGLRLLGEVLARLPGTERPVIQIVSASAGSGTGRVGHDLAAAAAASFGRTLLASPAGQDSADERAARGLSWLMTGLLGSEPDGIVPDAAVAGLYYAGLDMQQPGPVHAPVEAWLAGPQAFRMIVVESPAVAGDPRTLAVAAHCHGCILAVAAGASTQADVRAAARQLASTGTQLLGSVLHDAPVISMMPGRTPRAG